VSAWRESAAPAKLNLALVVGPRRPDGKHDVVTVLERLSLADLVAVRPATATRVSGFEEDTLVRAALEAVSESALGGPRFEARIEKRIPVAAGLGGGSSDAGTALGLANGLLERPLPAHALEEIAAALGADVPFFLRDRAQVGTADGTTLEPIDLPRDYWVVLALPAGVVKSSTAAVYEAFDARGGERGFDARRRALRAALARLERASDLGKLPPNDLAASPLSERLRSLGAFRADVTGAGPAVYGLFEAPDDAGRAAAALGPETATWIAQPG
jgi:4-diphosphocytidyl-2-C-methyl-D-erythritol kinase